MAEELTLVGVLVAALVGSILGPAIIEYLKLRTEPKRKERQESEERYSQMLKNLTGFISPTNKNQIDTFYEHYRLAWLYASDEVIKSINNFLNSIGGSQVSPTDADKASRKMIFEMRKAIKGKTDLKPDDFLIITVPERRPQIPPPT
jgi:alpha-amylase/alpha-mannosidase (GH57 family)